MGERKTIGDLDPLSGIEAMTRDHIIHTQTLGGLNVRSDVGEVIDTFFDVPGNSDPVTALSRWLTLDLDGTTKRAVIQDILDLVPAPSSSFTPVDHTGNMLPEDGVVIQDLSDSGLAKFVSVAELESFFTTIPVLSGNPTTKNAGFNIGSMQVRWGQYTSNSDTEQQFAFATPFSNTCHVCVLSMASANNNHNVSQGQEPNSTHFFVDRHDGMQASFPFNMIGIGW